ncbi:hypothetical protein [Methylobacterium brachythecii]|nr:hypothetical protein [Methylobacterium brachythecii]MBB3904242.1 hypothetical protein [Methylobacterium brachythecii]
MRADLAAAFFDCRDTTELTRRITAGDAPAPTAMRGTGSTREPIWALEACRQFITRRHDIAERESSVESVADLI